MTMKKRRVAEGVFRAWCFAMTFLGVLILIVLLYHVSSKGLEWLDGQFLSSFPSRFPQKAGIKSALFGSVWLMVLTTIIAVPLGVFGAVYLEEYRGQGKLARFIELNIANLAGVPSIIYGLLGLTLFVRVLGFGRSILSGALTMSLLVLPTIVMATREAIRAVPASLRHGAYALGATRWQTVWGQVLPAATPGMLTGIILATSRGIGETAPLIMIGALSFVAFTPESVLDSFTVLPIQVFNWAARPQEEFHEIAAAGIIVLLAVLLLMNAAAVWIRHKTQKKYLC